MKRIELANPVMIYTDATAVAYTQISNAIVWSHTSEELNEKLDLIKQILTAHLHFDWGFGKHHFWLKQRKELRSEELLEDHVLIVKS